MVAITTFTAILAFAASGLALPNPNPNPLTPDPAGAPHVGNGKGEQFITGACLSNADCGSGCCAVLGSGGICSGVDVANAQGKQGCGFNSAGGGAVAAPAVTTTAAAAAPAAPTNSGNKPVVASPVDTAAPGAQNVGKGTGTQFITGQCLSNADCASGCCATKGAAGVCSAVLVANEQGKTGCGFQGVAA